MLKISRGFEMIANLNRTIVFLEGKKNSKDFFMSFDCLCG